MADHEPDQKAPPPPDGLRHYFSRIGLYLPLLFIGGMALALLFYTQGLRLLGIAVTPQQPAALTSTFGAPDAPEVVLYASPTTRAFLHSVQGNQDLILKPWRNFFAESGRAYREINDPEALRSVTASVLILPQAIALSEYEVSLLQAYQRQGGAILATGAFGARGEQGHWHDWRTLQRLFAVKVTGESTASSPLRHLLTQGETPVTQNLPAGSLIWLGDAPESVLHFAGGHSSARLTNAQRDANGAGAGIVYGDVRAARWVLFGFAESSWAFQPTPIKTLVAGALDWLQQRPTALVATQHAQLSVALKNLGNRFELDISNASTETIHGASFVVFLPKRGHLTLQTSKARSPQAQVQALDIYRARIVFDALPPGNHAYHLNIE